MELAGELRPVDGQGEFLSAFQKNAGGETNVRNNQARKALPWYQLGPWYRLGPCHRLGSSAHPSSQSPEQAASGSADPPLSPEELLGG